MRFNSFSTDASYVWRGLDGRSPAPDLVREYDLACGDQPNDSLGEPRDQFASAVKQIGHRAAQHRNAESREIAAPLDRAAARRRICSLVNGLGHKCGGDNFAKLGESRPSSVTHSSLASLRWCRVSLFAHRWVTESDT